MVLGLSMPHLKIMKPCTAEEKLLPYIDIPLQHACPTIFKSHETSGK